MVQDACDQFGSMAPGEGDALLAEARDRPAQIVSGHERVLQITIHTCRSGSIRPGLSVSTISSAL